jgi:chemotaxis protein histidine kinase CheA
LVRNAVAHGIESPAERLAAGKPGAGRIHIAVSRDADGLAVAVRDDGRGISAAHLRESLEKTGRFTVQGLAAMDERALVATLFEPGVSTAQGVDAHSGRGVGLDLVKVAVTNLGGRIRVMSQPGRFTEFRLVLPVVAEVAA